MADDEGWHMMCCIRILFPDPLDKGPRFVYAENRGDRGDKARVGDPDLFMGFFGWDKVTFCHLFIVTVRSYHGERHPLLQPDNKTIQ